MKFTSFFPMQICVSLTKRSFAVVSLICLAFSSCVFAECTLRLNDNKIDYGRLTRWELQQGVTLSKMTSLDKRTLTLNATCGAKTPLELSFTGDRFNETSFRFAKNGYFKLLIVSAQLDHRAVQMRAQDQPERSNEGLIRPDESLVAYDGPNLALGEHLTVQIEIHPYIDDAETQVHSDVTFEGRGTFSIKTY